MTAWEEAVATALVGTERRPPGEAALHELEIRIDPPGAPEALLSQAVVLASRRAAGWLPPAGSPPPEPAPVDDRPVCSRTAAQVLDLLLQGEVQLPAGSDGLVGEWLTAAAKAGRRPPSRLLPTLLELAVTRPQLRTPALAVVGPPGGWLARRNPAWRRLVGQAAGADVLASVEARFSTGTRPEREQALTELRAVDPARGRELLAETWKGESAADRAGLLPCLLTGLGDEDEPFLEAALDDRAKSVRAVAAELLERLPSSRRAARMAARLEPLVGVGRRGVFRKKLEVAYPDEPDKAGRRDGINDDAPPGTGTLGPRAWWLYQLVAGAPLSFWPAHTGSSPADLVEGGAAAEVVRGWEWAAERQGNAEWARLLFTAGRVKPGLLAVLPPAEAAGFVERVVSGRGKRPGSLPQLLAAVPGPWPSSLSRAVLERYRQGEALAVTPVLPLLAERLDPTVAPLVDSWVTALGKDDYARRQLSRLLHALTLRRTMSEELS